MARSAAPQALAAHLQGSRPFSVTAFVEVPPSAAWNAVYSAVAARAPIAAASFANRRIDTDWMTETPTVEPGRTSQRRTRHHIQLNGSTARDFSATVTTEIQERTRGQCEEAGAWTAASASPDPSFQAATAEAIRGLGNLATSELTFPGTTDEVLSDVGSIVLSRWGYAATDRVGFPLAGGTRLTIFDDSNAGIRLEVGSSVAVAAAPRTDGVGLLVEGRLRWRGESGDDGTRWFDEDAASIVADFFARIADRRRPVTVQIAEVTPLEATSPSAAETELPRPAAVLAGNYNLFATSIAVGPPPGSSDWDPAMGVAGVIASWVPAAYRVYVAAAVPVTGALERAQQLVGAAQDRNVADQIFAAIGERIGSMAAPDISFLLTAPGNIPLSLTGPDDSPVAAWAEPIPVTLNGPNTIPWGLWDRDAIESDQIATGSFSIEELANACQPVCQVVGPARVCLELRAASASAVSPVSTMR
jgi:hypothetical protein